MANGKFKVQEFPTKRGGEDVVGWENTTIFSSVDFPRYNPDSLVQRHGLRIYQKMMLDEQVKAAITFKRDAVTSRDWVLDWASDSKLSDLEKTKRNAMLTKMLENMNGAFVDKLNSVLSGLVYGYSITEKVYGLFEFDGRPQSGIIALLPKDCSTFWFYTDDYGQLRDFRQKVSGKEQALDITKFVHYVHAPEEDEWHGASELRAAYRSYYAKDLMIKYWLIWGERAAGGFVKATRTAEAQVQPNTPAWDKLEKALAQIKTVGSILLPIGVDLEMIMPPAGDGFEAAIKFHDLAIAKSVLVPNLLGISHTGETGAYAQSQTQLEAFFWTLNATSRRLSACITEQVLKDAGESLFPDGQVPDFVFKPASLEHIKWVIQSWKDLVGAKVVTTTPEDEERLRQILEMPAKTPEEIEEAQNEAHAKAIEIVQKGAPPVADGEDPAKKPPGKFSKRADFESESERDRTPIEAPPAPMSKHASLTRATQRVNFAVINAREESIAQRSVPAAADVIARGVKKATGAVDVAAYTDANVALISDVALDGPTIGKLRAVFVDTLRTSWEVGASMARNELERARGGHFTNRAKLEALRDKAAEYLAGNGFRMAGNASDATKAIIQQELLSGVKGAKSTTEVRANIWDRLVSRGLLTRGAVLAIETDTTVHAALDELWQDTEAGAAHYLDTLVRTNMFEALNEARYEEFTSPDLGDFVRALEYAAVLDEKTTEICQSLDGRVYEADSDVWDTYRPPNHYNCRSVLVPITAVDNWDGIESPEPMVEPQEGFK